MLRSFPPIVDAHSRVLVLGTMPGPEALRKREYYGYARNHFWPIMVDLLAPGSTLEYGEKLDLLRRNRIALWDVLASCERLGAADSAIRNEQPNRVAELLAQYPRIRAIALNGGTAARLFARFHPNVSVPRFQLPSTSPANASISYARKRAQWARVVELARENVDEAQGPQASS